MDGVLLIDKPPRLTSHDVVARIRRTAGERRIGHTGTLDPLATGLLPLVIGRATRLSAWLTGSDKTYVAAIRLGQFTDTDDADGHPIGAARTAPLPDDAALDAALARFRGTFEQRPPEHSAKRIGGKKAYELARQQRPVVLAPVAVTVRQLEAISRDGDTVSIRVSATAGFYVRALARDLGGVLGCGAHLTALRRTHSGGFDLAAAIPLADAERLGPDVAGRLIPPSDALADLPRLRLSEFGVKRVSHGNAIGPEHVAEGDVPGALRGSEVRLLSPDGRLLAVARSAGGALHPVVVIG